MTEPEYLTINAICRRFRVSRSCVERAWKEKRLHWCGKIAENGREAMLFDVEDVLAWRQPIDVSVDPKPRREPMTAEERKIARRVAEAERRLVEKVKHERDDRPLWVRVKPYIAPTTTWDGAIGEG